MTNQILYNIKSYMEERQEWVEWINLLCDYGDALDYMSVREESINAMFAIMKYRRLLKSKGVGNISLITLNTAYIQEDYTKLHSLLQELFLETINEWQFKLILEKVSAAENGMVELYTKHTNDTNKRFLTLVMTL